MKTIAILQNDYETKFGVPRQSGLVTAVVSRIVFAPEYRNPDALRGLEDFSHLWLIWEFSEARMGVFATRSPFRPNPIGLSCVKIERIELHTEDGPVIFVSGADLMNGTPIYDIKPYLPYADCRPEASGGFAEAVRRKRLAVDCPPELLAQIPEPHRAAVLEILAQDPRPSYQHDPERVYGMAYAGMDVRFSVDGERLTVREIRQS